MSEVGVIAMQGAFSRHIDVLTGLGVPARAVRAPADLAGCTAFVLPGGESTTIAKLLRRSGLRDPLQARLRDGAPVLGTCAGAILLAREIVEPAPNDDTPFGIVDVAVRRNAFGRQLESFETDLDISGIAGISGTAGVGAGAGEPFHAVFIRAPWFEAWGVGVDVLAWQNNHAVMVREGAALLCAFHPELADDVRIHRAFLEITT